MIQKYKKTETQKDENLVLPKEYIENGDFMNPNCTYE